MVRLDGVYFALGRQCNLNCKYCKQCDERENDKLANVMPEKVKVKIKEILDKYRPPLILVTAGEPLLYLDQLKELVSLVEEVYNPPFLVYTNGTLLTEDIVKYFNEHDIRLNLSYDGQNSETTRGYNVLKDKKNLLFKLNWIKFGTVLTDQSYPLTDVINSLKTFYNVASLVGPEQRLSFIEEPLLPVNGKYYSGIPDYDRVKEEMYEICKKALLYLRGNKSYEIYYNFISSFLYRPDNDNDYSCGIGINTLVLDLEGNAITCPSVSKPLGNILDESVESLMDKVYHDGVTREEAEEMCKGCSAEKYCQYGCRLIRTKEEREEYCKGYRALTEPVAWLRGELNDTTIQPG